MGIEGGSIGSIGAVSAGPAVGSAISMGPSIGPSIGRVGSFINEGPVASGFLENTMPLTLNKFNPVGEIIFNPFKEELSVANAGLPSEAEAVDIAEQWLGILKPRTTGVNKIEPLVYVAKPMDLLWKPSQVLPLPNPEPVAKPKIEPKIQPNVRQIELSKSYPHSATLTEVNTKSAQENVVEQNLEEEVLTKKKNDEKSQVLEREEVEESKLKNVLDVEVAEQRIYEISEAIDSAQAEASKEGVEGIDGPRVLRFLRLHIGLISQIARKIRKDGSLDETLEELSSRRFRSKDQAKQQTKELVAEKQPVRRGKEGKGVKEGAVERVLKYHLVKRSPVEEVAKRVVKKHQARRASPYEAVPVVVTEMPVTEKRIEDNADLAELFLRKAA